MNEWVNMSFLEKSCCVTYGINSQALLCSDHICVKKTFLKKTHAPSTLKTNHPCFDKRIEQNKKPFYVDETKNNIQLSFHRTNKYVPFVCIWLFMTFFLADL